MRVEDIFNGPFPSRRRRSSYARRDEEVPISQCAAEGDRRLLAREVFVQVSEELLTALDGAWDEDNGFLGKLRAGVFDEIGGGAYVTLLRSIPPIGETVDSDS